MRYKLIKVCYSKVDTLFCRREQFVQFASNLEGDRQSPSWLGLPNNAEKVLLTNFGSDMLAKLMKMQVLEDDDDDIGDGESEDDSKRMSDGRPAWMRTLHTSVRTWLDLVPRVSSNIKIYTLR